MTVSLPSASDRLDDCLFLAVSQSASDSVCLWLSLSLPLTLAVSLSASDCLWLCLCLPLTQSVSLSASDLVCLSVGL